MQTDAFDGVFDTPDSPERPDRGWRRKYTNGVVMAEVRSNAINCPLAKQYDMTGAFGTYPARPNFGDRNA